MKTTTVNCVLRRVVIDLLVNACTIDNIHEGEAATREFIAQRADVQVVEAV
jgi:hypothetical protein